MSVKMKTVFSLLIGVFLLFSCEQEYVEKKEKSNYDKQPTQDTVVKIPENHNHKPINPQSINDTISQNTISQDTVSQNTISQDTIHQTYVPSDIIQQTADYPDIIKKHLADFHTFNLTTYSCSYIGTFSYNNDDHNYTHTNINELKVFESIDSIHYTKCKTICKAAEEEEEILNLNDYYLLSVEKPILGYFPITIFDYYVSETPMFLILFDKKGKFINGIEVANIYGEGEPGCLNSYFVNDSTLVREYSWDELDENENVIENAFQRTEKLVLHKDGSFTIVETHSSGKDE